MFNIFTNALEIYIGIIIVQAQKQQQQQQQQQNIKSSAALVFLRWPVDSPPQKGQ